MKAKEEYVDAPRETRSKDITVYAVIFLVLLVGAGIFLAVKLLHKPADAALADSKSGIVYDSSAVEGGWDNLSPEEIAERLNQKVEEGMINISMNTAPYFENGTAEGNLMLVNESINNYPQKVQIVRNDTGEQIYESGAIAVGSKIERAKLDVVLPAGTYECTAYFHNLDPETGDIIGTAGAIITITIQH
jgi:hypothetical protein